MTLDTCTLQFFISFGGSLVIRKMCNPDALSCKPWTCRMSGIPTDWRSGEETVRTEGGIAGPNQNHNGSIVPPLAVILDAAGHQTHSRAVLEQTVFCFWRRKAPQVAIPIIIHYHISIARRWAQLSYKNVQFAHIVGRRASCWGLNKYWIIYSGLYHAPLLKWSQRHKMHIYLSPGLKRVPSISWRHEVQEKNVN